jgi:hypothetical protein
VSGNPGRLFDKWPDQVLIVIAAPLTNGGGSPMVSLASTILGDPQRLKAVKSFRPLETDEHTFDARKDEECQHRCQRHHRQGNQKWFGFEEGINQGKHWKNHRNDDQQCKISRPIIDACVMKLLPATTAFVFNLQVSSEDLALPAGRAFQHETPENCIPRITIVFWLHLALLSNMSVRGKSGPRTCL